LKKEYYFLLPEKASLEKGSKENKSSSVMTALAEAIKLIGVKSGINISFTFSDEDEIRRVGSVKFAKKRIGKDIDFAVLMPSLYVYLKDKGVPIEPLVTYTVDNKKTDHVCLYVRKSDGLKDINDLKGKKLMDNKAIEGAPSVEEILYEQGITAPKEKFFDIVGGKQRLLDMAYSVVFRNADAFAAAGVQMKLSSGQDARFKELEPLVCTKEFTNLVIVYYNKTDPALIETLRTNFSKMHKGKEFQSVKLLFVALNGHFVPVDDSEYESWRDYYKRALKKGWMKKADLYDH